MPSGRTLIVVARRCMLAAIALVLLQAVLPGLHVLIDHCHPAVAMADGPGIQPGGDGDDDCPLCSFLHAAGHAVPPPPADLPSVALPGGDHRIVPASGIWLQPPPDVRGSSPRGPPAA